MSKKIKDILSKNLPAFIASVIFIFAISVFYFLILQANNNTFVYTLDDAYIHLSIAKNLAFHNVFGITEYGFTNASSAPLWSFLLAIFYSALGSNEIIPLIASSLITIIFIFYISLYIYKLEYSKLANFFILLLVIACVSMLSLNFMGMEHILQIFSFILLIISSVESLIDKDLSNKRIYILLALALVNPLIRYESLFIIGIISILFLIKKRWIISLLIIAFGLVPIAIFGLYSINHGWFFLPNSLMMKVGIPALNKLFAENGASNQFAIAGNFSLTLIINKIWNYLIICPSLFALSVAPILYLAKNRNSILFERAKLFSLLFLLNLIFHLLISRIDSTLRYEAYLIVLGIISNLIVAAKFNFSNKLGFRIFVFLMLLPLSFRAYSAIGGIAQSSKNIYEQQYQTAQFIKEYYNYEKIGVNDIGAPSYFTNARIFDLWGLANYDIAKAKFLKTISSDFYNEILNKNEVKIAIVYTLWFSPDFDFYRTWRKVSAWKIENNIACSCDEITFFAKDSITASLLLKNLVKYEKEKLPTSVKVVYFN